MTRQWSGRAQARWVLVGAMLATLATACSSGDEQSIMDSIRQAGEGEDRYRSYSSIVDAMPGPETRADAFAVDNASQLVLEGTVDSVVPGVSASWAADPAHGSYFEYGGEGVQMSTVHVTYDIASVIDAGTGVQQEADPTVTVSLWVEGAPPVDEIETQLRSLGTVVLFLGRRPINYLPDYKPSGVVSDGLWVILESGALLGTVDENGRILFPGLEEPDRVKLHADGLTVDELRAAA